MADAMIITALRAVPIIPRMNPHLDIFGTPYKALFLPIQPVMIAAIGITIDVPRLAIPKIMPEIPHTSETIESANTETGFLLSLTGS